jgi:hypothetical protein
VLEEKRLDESKLTYGEISRINSCDRMKGI